MGTILITGANRGIGLALAQQFAARGDHVIGVCRHRSDALDATGAQVEAGIDVTAGAAIDALAQRLHETRIDTLVLNAGILGNESLGAIDADGFDSMRRQFEVNALGPLRVAQAVRARIAAADANASGASDDLPRHEERRQLLDDRFEGHGPCHQVVLV